MFFITSLLSLPSLFFTSSSPWSSVVSVVVVSFFVLCCCLFFSSVLLLLRCCCCCLLAAVLLLGGCWSPLPCKMVGPLTLMLLWHMTMRSFQLWREPEGTASEYVTTLREDDSTLSVHRQKMCSLCTHLASLTTHKCVQQSLLVLLLVLLVGLACS